MEDSDTSLLCQETVYTLNMAEEEDVDKENTGMGCAQIWFSEDESEYIENLIRREAVHELEGGSSMESNLWWRQARLDSIEWILSARSFLGFHYRTAYLAVTYIDRFVAKRKIGDGKLWAVELLSMASLSLAAKMEECDVPGLSSLPAQKYEFKSRVITKMELLILHTLDWKMASITPFAYLEFFIDKLSGRSEGRDLFPDAAELVLAASKEINLVDCRPSIIAAAAVLASSSSAQLTRKAVELKTGVVSSWGSQHHECVFSCYILMLGLKKRWENMTPRGRLLPLSVGTFRSPSLRSTGGSLKRRLRFISNSDQIPPIKKANNQ